MRIAAFTKYDRDAASTRQRVLQYLPALGSVGIDVSVHPLLGNDYVRSLITDEPVSKARIAGAYLDRFLQLLSGPDCDLIWLYAEAFPFLPSSFERLVFRSGKPVVYDFDDAFFVTYDQHPSPWARRLLAGKLEPLIRGAAAVCCGNEYLREYALRFNPRSILLPTTVDTNIYRPIQKPSAEKCVIGWIGSPSTWEDVRPMLPVIASVCRERGARFHVIGAGSKALPDRFEGMELVDWSEAAEVSEVQRMDIGIMPLRDLPFQRGKSGYKLIQYMACGLPVVASPVGVNSDLVKDNRNGFLATAPGEWAGSLSRLIESAPLRAELGRTGRQLVEQHYSLKVHAPRLVELFESLVTSR